MRENDASENIGDATALSPKRNVIRKYGRARPEEETGGQPSATISIEKPTIEESNLLSDDDTNEKDEHAELRRELGLGGWNDEVDAIDTMPEDQLRSLPANLLDEFDSDPEENTESHFSRPKDQEEDYSLSMAEKRQIEEKQPAVELGEANDDIILMDANSVPSHQPLPFETDDIDDIPTKTKKPKGMNKKDVDDLHRETARIVREQNIRLESRSTKMTLADYYAKLAIKRGHAENKAEEILHDDKEQQVESTLLTNSKEEPQGHSTMNKPEEAPDSLIQQDLSHKKKEQSEKLKLLKLRALKNARKQKSPEMDANKDDDDIEILADENPAVGPLARAAGARLGAGKEDASSKLAAKRRWDSREAHRIRKFVGISERGKSGAKRRRSSEGTPNKKGKLLTNEELMENIRQKALNQEVEFKNEIEELGRSRKNKYHIPKPKTELAERVDPIEVALKRAAKQAEDDYDAADDEEDSEDDPEDGNWLGSAEEDNNENGNNENENGSEADSEEPDENEKEKENHSSFSSNATSSRLGNTRKPLGEAAGHAYDNMSDSDSEPRGYRRIRRIINDVNEDNQDDTSQVSNRLESPFAGDLQPEFYMNKDGLLTQSKPQTEFSDEDIIMDDDDEPRQNNLLKRNSYNSDNEVEARPIRERRPVDGTQETQQTEQTQKQATQATQAASQAVTQAATQIATQVDNQTQRMSPTQAEPIPTMKDLTQSVERKTSTQPKSAFDTLKVGMKKQEAKIQQTKSGAPIDPRFFEAQAEESDEENLMGLISEDEEEDDGVDRHLEELVNDERVAKELREKQDKLATEKYQEQRQQDDELDKKVAQNAVDGRYRYRRRHRTEDGLDMSSDDDDIEFMKAQEQLAARLEKKRRKHAGEEPMDVIARNPRTAAFAAAFEASANADEFEAEFDVEHTGGALIEQPEEKNQGIISDDDGEDSDNSDTSTAAPQKHLTLKEETEAMRKFMEKKHAFNNTYSSDSEDESQAMQYVRKGDPGKQKRKPQAPSHHNNDDEEVVTSYTQGRKPLSPRSLSKLKKFAQDEGNGANFNPNGAAKSGVTSFLADSNKSQGKQKKQDNVSKKKAKPSSQNTSQKSQPSSQSSQSKPASKLSSFGKWG